MKTEIWTFLSKLSMQDPLLLARFTPTNPRTGIARISGPNYPKISRRQLKPCTAFFFGYLKGDITLIRKEKPNPAINIDFLKTRGSNFKRLACIFQVCNPFPSWPSAANDTCQQF